MASCRADVLLLGAHDVHLWLAKVPATLSAAEEERLCAVMSPAERARHATFHHEGRRHEHAYTRWLARRTLSRYVPRPPEAWTFAFNEHGAPRIAPPDQAPGLRFNLSNTHGLVGCVVAHREVGVDLEWLGRGGRQLDVAHRYFAQAEHDALFALPPEHQMDRFFDLWTLKEAYIKARGMGLAIPLGKFAFELTDATKIRLTTAPELNDDGAQWSFQLLRPTLEHRAAVAVRGPLTLKTHWADPNEGPAQ